MENALNRQRKRNLKWEAFTKYRIDQGCRVKWQEEEWDSFSSFFTFCVFQGRERIMMCKTEGRNKTRKKMEGNLATSIIIVLLG